MLKWVGYLYLAGLAVAGLVLWERNKPLPMHPVNLSVRTAATRVGGATGSTARVSVRVFHVRAFPPLPLLGMDRAGQDHHRDGREVSWAVAVIAEWVGRSLARPCGSHAHGLSPPHPTHTHSAGIGKESTRLFASWNASVIMAVRNETKGRAVLEDIRRSTGSDRVEVRRRRRGGHSLPAGWLAGSSTIE